jgi:hypothetical protein
LQTFEAVQGVCTYLENSLTYSLIQYFDFTLQACQIQDSIDDLKTWCEEVYELLQRKEYSADIEVYIQRYTTVLQESLNLTDNSEEIANRRHTELETMLDQRIKQLQLSKDDLAYCSKLLKDNSIFQFWSRIGERERNTARYCKI